MRRLPLLLLIAVTVAAAQPSAVLNDLQHRAATALTRIPRAETWAQAVKYREFTKTRLRESLNVRSDTASAFLYETRHRQTLSPAVVLIRPHEDPKQPAAHHLPSAFTQLGFTVLEINAHGHHDNLRKLPDGVVPQALIQADVQGAMAYLRSRPDVDPGRVALVGSTLSATLAAALNPEFAAIVLLDGAPDFTSVLFKPDNCDLVPGLLRYAATEELLALIPPRPLLLINPNAKTLDYVTNLYRGAGAIDNISDREASHWLAHAQIWLKRHLNIQTNGQDQHESVPPTKVSLPARVAPLEPTMRAAPTEQILAAMLGQALPTARMTLALNCGGDHRTHLETQPGLIIAATVIRPGPEGCDAARGTLVAVDDRGRSALLNDEIVQEATRRGWVVWMLDPRHIGEMNTSVEPLVFALSLLLGENATWRQSADILRVIQFIAGRGSRYPTALYARGKNVALAASYIAAISDRRQIEWIVLRDAAGAWNELTDIPVSAVPIGARKHFDIPDLWKAATSNILVINDPQEFLRKDW